MGHAGAIVGGADDTAAAKMKIMEECGIHVVASPADIGKTMAAALKKLNLISAFVFFVGLTCRRRRRLMK